MKTTILVQCSIEHHGDKCGEDDRTHCPWAERSWYGCIAWNRSLSKVGCVGRERVRCSECLAATEGKDAQIQAMTERNVACKDRDKLKAQVEELEFKLAAVRAAVKETT